MKKLLMNYNRYKGKQIKNMLNINTNLEEQCKDKKKQTAKHEIITNPKNNTQKTNTNDN